MKRLIALFAILGVFCSVIFFNSAYGQKAEEATIIQTKFGGIRIILGPGWEKEGDDEAGALLTRSDPFGMFAVAISFLEQIPDDCNTDAYRRKFLARVKQLSGNEEGFEYSSYFHVPTLVYTHEVLDKKNTIRKFKDLYFLRDCKYYNISFGCEKSKFDKQWADMEARIKKITFLD